MSRAEKAHYVERLDRALKERIAINPLYSLRAFARDLGISPSQLSLILNGKRGVSSSLANRIAVRLGLSESEQHVFITEIQSLHSRNKTMKMAAQEELASLDLARQATFLSLDAFSVISNWYHLALVEALKLLPKRKLKSAKDQIRWLSQKLGISIAETEGALARLVRLELVELDKGVYRAVKETLFTGDKVPSEAVRSFHKQVLQKALQSIDGQSPDDRYLRSTMMPIAKQDLPKIKQKIKNFHESLIREFGNAENADCVYAFATQGFSLLKEEQKYEEF